MAKFSVELISEGRFLIVDEKGNPNICTGDHLADALRLLCEGGNPKRKRSGGRKKGSRNKVADKANDGGGVAEL